MNQDDWKQKYKQLAEEMDQLQEQLKDNSINHLLLQMSSALEGRSDHLDKELQNLNRQLNNSHIIPDNKTCGQVNKKLRGFDIEQGEHQAALLEALRKWIRQLRMLLTTDRSQFQVAEIEQSLDGLKYRQDKLSKVINDLVDMQTPILTEDNSVIEPEKLHEDLCSADQETLLQSIGSELLTLLSSLHIPKEEMVSARQLAAKIERGFDLPELVSIFSSVVALATRLGSYGSADFENYLVNLTGQLAEVQAYLVESQQAESQGNKASQLSNVIHRDVQAIHKAVKSSNDLKELKNEISGQLINIVKTVDTYKRREEEREQQLQQRYMRMNERLEAMEMQTQSMKVHMESERLKAMTDPLTSLPNRAGYDEQITAEFERWMRYQHKFSIAVADIDLFKKINDSFGHQAGDKVLRLIASLLSKKSRATDFVARYGGEEFVIILPSTDSGMAARAVDKIRQAIEKSPFNFHGKPVQITMSFGVAEIKEGETAEQLFSRADQALYKAKHAGRNRVETG